MITKQRVKFKLIFIIYSKINNQMRNIIDGVAYIEFLYGVCVYKFHHIQTFYLVLEKIG